jgi:hypothetical protein
MAGASKGIVLRSAGCYLPLPVAAAGAHKPLTPFETVVSAPYRFAISPGSGFAAEPQVSPEGRSST